MTLTVIAFVISALGKILKGMETRLQDLEVRRQVESIKTTLLENSTKSPEDLRRLLSLKLQ